MDSVWKTFRAAKLGTTAAWALGITTLATVLGPSPAHAGPGGSCTQTDSNPINVNGGPTDTGGSPGPGLVGDLCDGADIAPVSNQNLPSYWEFTWNDASGNTAIGATLTQGSPSVGSFTGELQLLTTNGTVLGNSGAIGVGSVTGDTGSGSLTYDLANGANYEVGVVGLDPGVSISFNAAPEPASLGIFGGALAALAALRKRRKLSR